MWGHYRVDFMYKLHECFYKNIISNFYFLKSEFRTWRSPLFKGSAIPLYSTSEKYL